MNTAVGRLVTRIMHNQTTPRSRAGLPSPSPASWRGFPLSGPLLLIFALGFLAILPRFAMAAAVSDTVTRYDVSTGDAITTLKQAAEQGGFEIMFPVSTVRNVQTKAVRGGFTPMQVIESMLVSTGLSAVQDDFSGAITVLKLKSVQANPSQPEYAKVEPAAVVPAKVEPPASDSGTSQDNIVKLSPFDVAGEKDYGYLKTNSATATRIGESIQKVPMNISVISQDFMQDTDLHNTNDIFKYMASASGDSQVGAVVPSNNQTPQGHNTLRGFLVNIILRNGVLLYSTKDIADTVERIEVIKGPAAVFFGQGYPGGVINYITKKAQLTPTPSTLRYTVGSDKLSHVTMDLNQVLNKRVAVRVISGWENSKGQKDFEYVKRFTFDGSMVMKPFDNDRLKVTAEVSNLNESFNSGGIYSWIFPNQYFKDYQNPSAALISAAGVGTADQFRAKIQNNLAAWSAAYRKVLGDPTAPIYTNIQRGAFYTDAGGNRIQDDSFSFQNRGSQVKNDAAIAEFTVESKVTDWLDGRYVYSRDNTKFDTYVGYWYPNADGRTFRLTQNGRTGYYRKTDTHQADLIFHFDTHFLGDMKHKILAGYLFDKYLQQYNSTMGALYNRVPGYNAGGSDATNGVIPNELANVPVNQVIRDRFGNIKSATDVYNLWDPGYEIQPVAGPVLYPIDRTLLQGFKNQDNAWYVNYQLTALNDRLTTLAGFRRETYRQGGEVDVTNFPWFAPSQYAYADTVTYNPSVYNYSPSALKGSFVTQTGDSWMAGASFEVVKDVNVYATYSKTFHYNGGVELGYYTPYVTGGKDGLPALFQATINAYAQIGQPLIYKFTDGTSRVITTVAQAEQAITDAGADRLAQNETGENREIGAKTSLWNGKLTATVSIFQADRLNQRKEDGYHQSIDVFNFNSNPIITASGTHISPDGDIRHFRWYSNDAHDRTQGTEFETIWTPIRNFQSYITGSWIWTAKTISDPTIVPGNVNYNIYFKSRLESTPEYTFKTFNKYTFSDGAFRGLSFGLGIRYASATVISRTNDWNPLEGGALGANYTVFDLTIGYAYKVFGQQLRSQLGIYNLADKVYTDGWYSLAPARYWTFNTTVTF
ncbi:MAG: TonB-dependent receptor plug domain-containing protein [Opitutaceae bacterium]